MSPDESTKNKLSEWQISLLPFIRKVLTFLAVFFFFASLVQLFYLHTRIYQAPKMDLGEKLANWENDSSFTISAEDRLKYTEWKGLALLEELSVSSRYHQANVLLMARIWTQYLGFITGMILSLVGAVFILGKFSEPVTTIDLTEYIKASLKTSSPGIVLVLLGTLLMLATILTHHKIEVVDEPIYFRPPGISAQIQAGNQSLPSANQGEEAGKKMREEMRNALFPGTSPETKKPSIPEAGKR